MAFLSFFFKKNDNFSLFIINNITIKGVINMNNLRKIGLSALAGSLATFSVNAADVSVSGGASISFDDTNRGKGDRGNGFYMGDSLKFNMSGETDGGLGVAVYYEIDQDDIEPLLIQAKTKIRRLDVSVDETAFVYGSDAGEHLAAYITHNRRTQGVSCKAQRCAQAFA